MQVLPISTTNNYNESFKSIYRVPVKSEKNITDFEKHIAPLYKSYVKQPIKGVFDRFRGLFTVFTGKEDVALYESCKPRQFGVITRIDDNGEVSIDKYTRTITRYSYSQSESFANKTSDMQPKILNNFKDLFVELFK